MTDFHCIRNNNNVRVPNSRVCGFRTSNNATKKGWSSGLKTGSDNLCGHRMSRFSTDLEADEANETCQGNTNWLGYDGASFNRTRVNNPWELEREAFRSGGTWVQNSAPNLPKNERNGMGNYNLQRPSFTAPDILPRHEIDFDKINALNLAQFGAKVQLGEETLEALLGVSLPDPSDRSWIAEYNRRKAAGETEEQLKRNPPFGRPQRMIKKRINFGEAKLNLDGSVAAITAAVEAGRAETLEQRRVLGIEVARVLGTAENIRDLSRRQTTQITNAVNRLKIPKDWRANNFEHRFWTNDEFKQKKGPISLFLMSNIQPDRSPNQPLMSWDRGRNSYNPAGLLQVFQMGAGGGDNRKVLDLQNRTIEIKSRIMPLLLAGIDDGKFNGVDVRPAAPVEEKKEEGLASFVSAELIAAMPEIRDWEVATRGGTPADLLEIYRARGITPPPALVVAATPLELVPGEFGVP